jgi:CRP-like cAMP-binding protein
MPNIVQSASLYGSVKLEKKFSVRTMVPCPDSCLFRIKQGAVRTLTYLDDGTAVVLGVWNAEDIVGGMLSHVKPYFIECLTAVEGTLFVPDHSLLTTGYMKSHLQQIEELIIIRSHKTIELRVIKVLSWLFRKFGEDKAQGQLINLRLTHQDLADLLGTTRVTMTRTLGQLEAQGLIQKLSLGRIILRESDTWFYEI